MKTRLVILFLCQFIGLSKLDAQSWGYWSMEKYGVDVTGIDTSGAYLFTERGASTTCENYSAYYRRYILVQDSPKIFRIREYWNDGTIRRAYNSKWATFTNRMGEYKEYNKKGVLVYSTYYDKRTNGYGINEEIGPQTFYYDNGMKMAQKSRAGLLWRSISFWDSMGKPTIIDGNGFVSFLETGYDSIPFTYSGAVNNYYADGTYTGTYSNRVYCRDIYKKGEFIRGESYDEHGKVYKYLEVMDRSLANTCADKLMEELFDHITFDASSIGTYWADDDVPVYFLRTAYVCRIEVTVDKNGKVADTRMLQSINNKIDNEILDALRFIQINPLLYRGQKVVGHYILSLAIPH